MNTNTASELITTVHAAREIGVTEVQTRRLDPALQPMRTSTGIRLYDRRRVCEYAARRDATRDARGR